MENVVKWSTEEPPKTEDSSSAGEPKDVVNVPFVQGGLYVHKTYRTKVILSRIDQTTFALICASGDWNRWCEPATEAAIQQVLNVNFEFLAHEVMAVIVWR